LDEEAADTAIPYSIRSDYQTIFCVKGCKQAGNNPNESFGHSGVQEMVLAQNQPVQRTPQYAKPPSRWQHVGKIKLKIVLAASK